MAFQVEVAARGADRLGECPLWDEREKMLWWVDSRWPAVKRLDIVQGNIQKKRAYSPLREIPLLDFLAAPVSVKQIVLKDLVDNYEFSTPKKVDRCATCHILSTELGYDAERWPVEAAIRSSRQQFRSPTRASRRLSGHRLRGRPRSVLETVIEHERGGEDHQRAALVRRAERHGDREQQRGDSQ